jgi:hypothetical protein
MGEEIAHCPSCSLVIRVVYNPADFQSANGETGSGTAVVAAA